MKNEFISIVVPVYNVQQFLDNCIESLVNQTYKNIEIILVDDGSTDECPQKCDEWKLKDNRIKVIHKLNQGLGMARNTGIENAKGKYICFVDSDDEIDRDTIKESIDSNFDIIYFGHKDISSDGKIINRFIPTPTKNSFNDEEIIKEFLPSIIIDMPHKHNFNMNFSSCMCLISTRVIRKYNWRFVSERDIISEDLYSLMQLFKNIKSVKIINKDFYSYRKNYNSLTRSYRADRFIKIKELYKELKKIYNNKEIIERIEYLFLSYTISSIKQVVSSNLKYTEKKNKIKEIINDKDFIHVCETFKHNDSFIRKLYIKCILWKIPVLIYMLAWIQNKRR